MKLAILAILASTLVFSCGPTGSVDTLADLNKPTFGDDSVNLEDTLNDPSDETIPVCLGAGDPIELETNQDLAIASTEVEIESAKRSALDIGESALPLLEILIKSKEEEQKLESILNAWSMLDIGHIYASFHTARLTFACNESSYEENGCNFNYEKASKQETIHGSNKTYQSTQYGWINEQWQRILTIEGSRNDLGNISVTEYSETGDLVWRVTTTRDIYGSETSLFEGSLDINVYVTENSDCSGSAEIKLASEEEGDSVLNANWNFDGSKTSGSFLLQEPNKDRFSYIW